MLYNFKTFTILKKVCKPGSTWQSNTVCGGKFLHQNKLIKKTHLTMSLFYGAANLPKLELFKIVFALKQLLNEKFILDFKCQLDFLDSACYNHTCLLKGERCLTL